MKILKIIILALFINSSTYSQIVYINSAGSTEVNGSYSVVYGDTDVPYYQNTSYFLYYHGGTHWVIGTNRGEATSGSGVYYSVESHWSTPVGLNFTEYGALGVAPLPSSSDSPLPVELTVFKANVDETLVTLNWETATEVNNYGFEIERQNLESSNKKSEWELISFVEGHGNSNSPKYYRYEDNRGILSGKYIYRLKQIDIDGRFEYSDVVEVSVSAPNNYTLDQNYPNPFNPTTTIKYSITSVASGFSLSQVVLKVYDVLGKEIKTLVNENLPAGIYEVEFDASEYPSGLYFYSISAGEFTQTRRMLLVK
jgi:Secretion system C-terminal sorting domain